MEEKPISDIEDYGLDECDRQLNKSTQYFQNLRQANAYNIPDFDPIKELSDKRNFACTITSKRRTGKSVLLKDICHKIKGFYHQVYVFSMTSDLQPELYDFVDKKNIYSSFDEAKLQDIWNQQEKLITSMKVAKVKDDDMPHVLIIFDDIISDPKVRKSEILAKYAVAGRHIKLAYFILSQTFTGVPPMIRTNVDIAIAFYLDSCDNREAYAKQYLSTKNTRLGIMLFERMTRKEYQAIVCLNFKTSQNPEDTVRKYTAKLKVPKFKMGKNKMKDVYIMDSFMRESNQERVELKVSKSRGSTIKL